MQLMSFDKRTIRVLNDTYDWDFHSGRSPKEEEFGERMAILVQHLFVIDTLR